MSTFSTTQQIGVPLPDVTAWAVIILELVGGLALVVDAFVVVVSIPLMISMFVAMFTVNFSYGFSSIKTIGLTADGPVFNPPDYEINLYIYSRPARSHFHRRGSAVH